jgi:phosphatidylglycerophosphate synthase
MAEEEKEGYWTPLEKYVRDYLFTPLTWLLGFIPYAANILTVGRFMILFWAMLDFLFYHNPIERQVWFVAVAWTTDLLDGPTARNNKNITAFGTIADHAADFFLILWMLFLSFYITGSLEKLASILMYTALAATTFGMLLVPMGMWLFKREKRAERPDQPYLDFIQEFLLKDLVTTVGARVHTGLIAFGVVFYLAGAIWHGDFYLYAGAVLLLVQLVSLGFYLHEIFQARYENRMYKMRLAFQRRIADLEETLKRHKSR